MDRTTGRALALATLQATDTYATVYDHEPNSFGGASPVATVFSKSLGLGEVAHADILLVGMLWVSLYVRRDGEDGSAVETTMDSLAREALLALREAFGGGVTYESSAINPSEAGYLPVDGVLYRVERFGIRIEEELDDPA